MSWKTHFPEGDLWVFGYGSLIWKPPPHYDQRVPGYIQGYVRRFWQASADHRGTPEAPGRVVTVIERSFWETLPDEHRGAGEADDRVWGAAYHIPATHAEEVHAYLDEREINGYTAHFTPFHPYITDHQDQDHHHRDDSPDHDSSRKPMTCMVYIGLPSNPQFLRDETERKPASVARVIRERVGKSGRNVDYLFMLEKALQGIGLGSADGHVVDLAGRVRGLMGVEGPAEEGRAAVEVGRGILGGEDGGGDGDGAEEGDGGEGEGRR